MEENPKPRRRWFRFSLRTMLVLVTLVCVTIPCFQWLRARRKEFLFKAWQNESWAHGAEMGIRLRLDLPDPEGAKMYEERRDFFIERSEKWNRAATFPFLSVEEDDLNVPPRPAIPGPATQD